MENNENITSTFELIRQARLEKIKLDVAIRKIKLDDLKRMEADEAGRVLMVDDVVNALNRELSPNVVDDEKCKQCKAIMKTKIFDLLHLVDSNKNRN